MPIELVQIFCRNPILFVNSSADLLHHVSAEEIGVDLESCNEARAALFDIPIARDLYSIGLVSST